MPGFNADASHVIDPGKLINWTRDYKPDAHTIIDDWKQGYSLSRALHDASPTTLLVQRHYHPGGENKQDYLDIVNWNIPDFAILGIGNEPGLDNPTDLDNTMKQNIAALDKGALLNKSVCVGNYSTGSYRQADIDAGKYDDLLRKLDEYHDLHYLGLHEYKLARLPYIFIYGRELKDLVDPSRAGETFDVTPEEFVKYYMSQYHIGRYLRLVERCKVMNPSVRPPRIILTEYGWDRNGDEIRQVPQLDSFAERVVTGIDTLATYNRKMWNWRSWEASAADQIEHLEPCYTEHVVGKCLYAWTVQSEWEKYDFGRHDKLLELLPKGKPVSQQPQFPYADHDSRWESVDIYPLGDFANFRAGDTLNAEVYFEIRERMKVDVLHAGDFKPEDKVWIPFRITRDGQTYRGYIRSDVIGIDWLLEVPLPDNTLDIRIKLNNALLALNEMDEKLDYLRDQITRAVEGLN